MDKLAKVRTEVARIQLYTQSEVLKQVLDYIDEVQKEPVSSIWHGASEPPIIDKTFLLIAPNGNSSLCLWGGKELHSVTIGGGHSVLCRGDIYSYIDDLLNLDNSCNFGKNLQEEPVSDRLAFKAIPRLLEMIEPTDRAKSYTAKLADALEVEGYSTDAKIVRESLKIMNGEKVPMATMDGEPVSEKKCIFTKDSYTDEDRKALCEDCKEKCSKKEEFVSEELDEAAFDYAESCKYEGGEKLLCIEHFKAGANWQKEQFEKNRLAHCGAQTEEEAEIEQSFVMGIIECEHRQPTFDDAIKYGMRLQKEQIKEALLSEVLPYFMLGGEADEVVAKLDEVLNQKK